MRRKRNVENELNERVDFYGMQVHELQENGRTQEEINKLTCDSLTLVSETIDSMAETIGFLRTAVGVLCLVAGGLAASLASTKCDIQELKNAMNEG